MAHIYPVFERIVPRTEKEHRLGQKSKVIWFGFKKMDNNIIFLVVYPMIILLWDFYPEMMKNKF